MWSTFLTKGDKNEKKVTLSAAVLALSMMGCSDVGLDNSVASTNEVKKEAQGQNFLAKLQPEPLAPSDVDPHSGYRVYDYTKTEGIKVHVHSRPDDYSWKGRGLGTFWVEKGDVPDVSNVLVLAVANCHWVGTSVTCDQHKANYMSCVKGAPYNTLCGKNVPNDMNVSTAELGGNISRYATGVMASYGSIWNVGTANENIFSATTYGGALPDEMAYAVYMKYLMQAQDNLVHDRPIDCMPGEQCYH